MRNPITAAAFAACLLYAAVRYLVLGGAPASRLPLYVTNKAVSMVAIGLLAFAAATARTERARWAGQVAILATVLHVVMSLPLLREAYLKKLFGTDGHFTALAEVALLTGGLAFVLLMASVRRAPALTSRVSLLMLVAGHCATLGWRAWWQPATWPGGLPPISMLTAAFSVGAAVTVLARARRVLQAREPDILVGLPWEPRRRPS